MISIFLQVRALKKVLIISIFLQVRALKKADNFYIPTSESSGES